jgi:hypothetical protein
VDEAAVRDFYVGGGLRFATTTQISPGAGRRGGFSMKEAEAA